MAARVQALGGARIAEKEDVGRPIGDYVLIKGGAREFVDDATGVKRRETIDSMTARRPEQAGRIDVIIERYDR
ncbi:MAG: hypothetical protein JF608_02065 [Sphingomonadales bacterium]|nr:hypothetical protein [Sphingomonadales bacterium]